MTLNPSQETAVKEGGIHLVLAGPGSGKTRAIIGKVLHLVSQGVLPDHILALTFPDKAASEMQEQLEGQVDTSQKNCEDPKAFSEPGGETIGDTLFFHSIEMCNIIFEFVDPGADRERDADRADDRLSLVESLDLDCHLREVLFCAPYDDIPVSPVTKAHDNKGVDLCKHFLVNVFGLLGHDAEPDAELPPLHRTFPEDLGARTA